jgi:hypothetical protein
MIYTIKYEIMKIPTIENLTLGHLKVCLLKCWKLWFYVDLTKVNLHSKLEVPGTGLWAFHCANILIKSRASIL